SVNLSAGSYGFTARVTLIEAQWRRLELLGAFENGIHANVVTWLCRHVEQASAVYHLSDRGSKRAVEELGAWLRRLRRTDDRDRGPEDGTPRV
ncbi:MAG TPA: hypothetical protein VN970_07385, partial [Thermoanaerobaculia bacterium]|nr:hypothetical protein [Thermoanaerobaculia bacterium]